MVTIRKIIKTLLFASTVAIFAAKAGAQDPPQRIPPQGGSIVGVADRIERARELLKQTRTALGGDESLRKIQTLSTSAKIRRYIKYISVQSPKKVVEKEKTLSGKLEFNFSLPDRFQRRVTGETLRGFGYSYIEVVNGARAWRKPPLRAISSNRDSRVINVDDFERTIELQERSAKQQLALYALGWLLYTPPSFPLKYSYVGRMLTYSGVADVIVVDGPENLQLFLLLNPNTRLPLALAVTFIESRQQTVLVETTGFFDRRFMTETFLRARQERQTRMKPPQRIEMHLQFADHRQIDGVLLPHRITATLNGEIVEEMTFKEFELNKPINPKKFEGMPESNAR